MVNPGAGKLTRWYVPPEPMETAGRAREKLPTEGDGIHIISFGYEEPCSLVSFGSGYIPTYFEVNDFFPLSSLLPILSPPPL